MRPSFRLFVARQLAICWRWSDAGVVASSRDPDVAACCARSLCPRHHPRRCSGGEIAPQLVTTQDCCSSARMASDKHVHIELAPPRVAGSKSCNPQHTATRVFDKSCNPQHVATHASSESRNPQYVPSPKPATRNPQHVATRLLVKICNPQHVAT